MSRTDVDGNLTTVQLAVANGTVTVTLPAAATICTLSLHDALPIFSGSQADINATLASLAYQGTLNYNGPDTLTENSAESKAASDLVAGPLLENPMNEAPVKTAPGAKAANGETALGLRRVSVTEMES